MTVAFQATAAPSAITSHGDTTIIVDNNGDSTVITSRVAGLVEKIVTSDIMEHLDDTIVDNSHENDYNGEIHENDKEFLEINRTWSSAVSQMAGSFCVAVVFIVFFVLFFRHANRRRKYKVLEKAIENNYQLPDGVFGEKTTKVIYNTPQYQAPAMGAQAQQPVQGTPVPPPFRSYDTNGTNGTQAQGQQPSAGQPAVPVYNQINWQSLQGTKLVAVGLGGCIFGLITSATPLVGIFCIPLFIGAFKMFTSYMDQRNAILAAQFYSSNQQYTQQGPTQHAEQAQPAQAAPEHNQGETQM